jgi:ABC-type uncharacterized transport system fused permease/ATPase subunit
MTERPATELLQRIADDVRTIARDEAELMRGELVRGATAAAIDGAITLFGAIVALIGFTMLCAAAAVALAPVFHSLALALVVVAIVYVAIGGLLVATFGQRIRRDALPRLAVPLHEAHSTIAGVKARLDERGRPVHA